MRLIALIANFVVLFLLFRICVIEPLGDEWVYIAIFMTNVILNIIVLLTTGGWIGMYFKRKRLEEKKKIEALEKQGGE